MRLVDIPILVCLSLASGCVLSSEPDHYKNYETKVLACIEAEKSQEPLKAIDLDGLDHDSAAIGVFYLKEERIVECSAKEELNSLVHALSEDSSDLSGLRRKYLSIGLVEKEFEFLQLTKSFRAQLLIAVKGKSLEVDLVRLFDELNSLN